MQLYPMIVRSDIGKRFGRGWMINYNQIDVKNMCRVKPEEKATISSSIQLEESVWTIPFKRPRSGERGLDCRSFQHDLTPVHIKSLSLHVVFMLLPILRDQGRERHGEILRELTNLVE